MRHGTRKVYEVVENGYYYTAKLDDGEWTSPHFKGFEIGRPELDTDMKNATAGEKWL